ncbi:MAG: polyphosphate polymerase domain-containing protein [Planctomycetes bacterium]|nr:polyphosphate polymerase domain-containing protein [Planctomycetota bacterium]
MASAPHSDSSQSAASAYVRSFNRFELKYFLTLDAARELQADLATHCVPDPHSGAEGYSIYSLYWDSPELRCFWEKLDGEKYRRKLRFRRYLGGDEVFVEIKQRIDRTVQKRRTRMPVAAALALFDRGTLDGRLENEQEDAVVREALVLARENRLAPKCAIRYRRQAWFATFEPDLRITFDTRIQSDVHELDLARPFETGRTLLPPQLSVLEVKFNQRIPLWMLALTKKHRLEVVRFSKYCAAVDQAFFGGRHDLAPRVDELGGRK